jgi:hypothetical protein
MRGQSNTNGPKRKCRLCGFVRRDFAVVASGRDTICIVCRETQRRMFPERGADRVDAASGQPKGGAV